jgi:hypothetical protein
MNAANLDNSDRLQRVLRLLLKGGEFTTLDIVMQAQVCAVNSVVAELRQHGYAINCQRRGDKWFYRLKR